MKFHCPICKKPTDSNANAEFPFCSERCKLLDLGAWANSGRAGFQPRRQLLDFFRGFNP